MTTGKRAIARRTRTKATAANDNRAITIEVARQIHENAVDHGWWDEERGFPEVLALIHSEVSEALEEYRNGRLPTEVYTGNNGKPEGIPIELADVIIRVLDYCGYAGIDIDAAISQKHEYNRTRPYRHGGKKC